MRYKSIFTVVCLVAFTFFLPGKIPAVLALDDNEVNIEAPVVVPIELDEKEYLELIKQKNALDKEVTLLRGKIKKFNSDCKKVSSKDHTKLNSCQSTYAKIQQKITDYNNSLDNYNLALEKAKKIAAKHDTFPLAAANLVNALDKASQKMNFPRNVRPNNATLNCSTYFHNVGEELRQQGLPATSKAWTTADANNIVKEIAENKNQQWQVRDEKEVQRLANSGVIVVGVYNGEPRKEHGHVAIAFPLPPHFRTSQFPGSGPFVRDGNTSDNNTEGRLYSRSWGAVRASKVFGSSRRPTWYIWVPSQK